MSGDPASHVQSNVEATVKDSRKGYTERCDVVLLSHGDPATSRSDDATPPASAPSVCSLANPAHSKTTRFTQIPPPCDAATAHSFPVSTQTGPCTTPLARTLARRSATAAVALVLLVALLATRQSYHYPRSPVSPSLSRRSLAAAGSGAASGSGGKLTPGFVANITAGVKAVTARVYAIKKGRGKTKMTDSCANDCLSLMTTALDHLTRVSKALKTHSSASDVPYWLTAAQDQLTTCLDGFREFSPATLSTPAGKSLQAHGRQVKKSLDRAIKLSLHSA
ncbi:unnamed protein product [Closterium sp. Yama58-4]|nr:unnamed protein product [Closterium sp. Yama58-4]